MTIAELVVKIGADASQFVQQMEATKRQVATAGKAMESMGRKATYAVTLPMLSMVGAMVKVSASMEQTRIAMTTMTGSAEKAGAMLQEIRKLAIETPFGLQELTTATRQLLAYNFAGDKAVGMLRTVGDAAAALGQGSFGMERIIRAMGQMQAKSRVMAQEMNQLAEVGINGWNMIADATGMAVKDVQKATEQGQISAAVGIEAILRGMNQRFGGAMAAQNKTLAGQWERLVDTAKATMRDFGDAVLPIAKGIVQSLGNSLKTLSDRFAAMDIHEKNATMAMYVMIAAIPPLVMMIGKIIGAIGALKLAGLGTFAVGGPIAIGVAALAGLIYLLTKRWLEQKAALGAFNTEASATVIAMNGMTEGQQRLNLAFRQGLLARYNKEYADLPSRAADVKPGQTWEQVYNRRRQLELLIRQNEREVGAIQGVIGQRGAAAGGAITAGSAVPIGGEVEPEMTAEQKYAAKRRMLELQLEAFKAHAREQLASAPRSAAPGIWGAQRLQQRAPIEYTVERMAETGRAAERFQRQFDNYVGSFTQWTNGFLEVGDRIGNVAASIAMNWQNAGQIIKNALQQITAQLIAAITKALVFKALMTMFGIPTGGEAGLSFGGIVRGAMGFAEGGIVTKPTLAVIGEKHEPEAVIPLSKVGQFGGKQTINIVLDGQVLASAVVNRHVKEVRMRGVLAA